MYERDGMLIMEGLDAGDPKRIKSVEELYEYVDTVGFLPLFRSHVDGFSLEELTSSGAWWSETEEDPWEWRKTVAEEGKLVYGKFFGQKAGFLSKEWLPYFASYRRDGYDFDTLYELGMAPRRSKLLMDVLEEDGPTPSYLLKEKAGFGKNGEKGYDGAIVRLMMETYVVISGFSQKVNRLGNPYGWSVASYCTAEQKFGYDFVRSAYHLTKEEALTRIMDQMHRLYPSVCDKDIRKEI